mmetsp:Transcript_6079/g.10499  ORF Transcript_6079/g.10499 Transcript_6079/m.10499 type:complete len:207 (-) Transcript_6079:778-1398(-)
MREHLCSKGWYRGIDEQQAAQTLRHDDRILCVCSSCSLLIVWSTGSSLRASGQGYPMSSADHSQLTYLHVERGQHDATTKFQRANGLGCGTKAAFMTLVGRACWILYSGAKTWGRVGWALRWSRASRTGRWSCTSPPSLRRRPSQGRGGSCHSAAAASSTASVRPAPGSRRRRRGEQLAALACSAPQGTTGHALETRPPRPRRPGG